MRIVPSLSLHADVWREVENYHPPTMQQASIQGATLQLLDTYSDAPWRSCRSGHVTASAVVVDPSGRVLLTHHAKYGYWMQLGGHMEETDISLQAAALRECYEESGIATGLTLEPDILTMDIHATPCPEPGGAHHDVVYLVHAPADSILHVSAESTDLAWFGDLPSATDDHLRRAVAAARARL